jgi:formamidopyrimidine-DNA glycosylase
MPELPEAETIVRGLADALPGHRIEEVEVLHGDVLDRPATSFSKALRHIVIEGMGRRGKNLLLHLEDGRTLVVNLGMSGRLLFRRQGDETPPPSHPALRFHLDAPGTTLVYHDVRRFGRLDLHTPESYTAWSASLGPEPLGSRFTGAYLEEAFSRSTTPLRSWLLDQRKVAGVGNIYASEAAFLARIHPRRRVHTIEPEEARRLHRSVRKVLREAIEARGTTLRDYRTADGWEGAYAGKLRVYGRDGEGCRRCRATVERIVFSNRSAFFCPACQPPEGLDRA